MLVLSRMRFVLGLLMLLGALFCTSSAEAQGKANKKNVVIKTFDGVELEATLYPNPTGKREATVILLHDFDTHKGGTSQTQNWSNLAAALQADGYTVISFDFRGFGESKKVDPAQFWARPFNKEMVKNSKGGKATEIDFKNFSRADYYPYLINDLAAVKAYLDRQHDNRECNTASTILIGAGNGAAVGSLWMGHESRRRRDKNQMPLAAPLLGELEVKDIAAAMWLSPSNRIGTKVVGGAMGTSLVEGSQKNKVPVAFIYGSLDATSSNLSDNWAKRINGSHKTKMAVTKSIKGTKLAGDKLLVRELETEKWILGALNTVMETRGARERIARQSLTSRYYYVGPPPKNTIAIRVQKQSGEEVGMIDFKFIPGFSGN